MLKRLILAALVAATVGLCPLAALATVTTTTSSVSYSASGSTGTFAVPFAFNVASDLVVTDNGFTKTLGTDYTVSCVICTSGGSVVFTVNPLAGHPIVISRSVPLTQLFNPSGQGKFWPPSYGAAFDTLEMQLQQVNSNSSAGVATNATNLATETANRISADTATNNLLASDLAAMSAGGAPGVSASNSTVIPTGATAANALKDVLQIIGYNLAYFLPVGYVTDCSVDYAAQINAAITATQNSVVTHTLRLPKGCFKTTAALTSTNINILGEGPDQSEIDCYGVGACLTYNTTNGFTLSGIKFLSKAASQTGVIATGTHPRVSNLKIWGFDTNGFQLGIAGSVGAYFSEISNLNVTNVYTLGVLGVNGVLVSGAPIPSTNANHFTNVYVSGCWTNSFKVDGNKNVFEGGDSEPSENCGGTGSSVFNITGSGNEFHGVYVEPVPVGTFPSKLATFSSSSASNIIDKLQLVSAIGSASGLNQSTIVSDAGWNNKISTGATGFNFLTLAGNDGAQNLVPNSAFLAWDTVNVRPVGWVNAGVGTLAQETVNVRGTAVSLSVTGTALNFNVQAFIFSSSVGDNSEAQVQIGNLTGRQVTCSVWCKSSFAGIGNLRVASTGTGGASVGNVHHSGSGAWELLTASQLIPTDATKVWTELRASNGGGTLTGTVYFSEPMCVVGTTMPYYSPRPLTDNIAVMHGALALNPPLPLTFGASIGTDASRGNQFTVTATSAAAFSFSSPTNLRSGQHVRYTIKNTSGGATAVPTWGATFKVPTLVLPATGFNRTYDFAYDGTNLIFQWQTAADVPN